MEVEFKLHIPSKIGQYSLNSIYSGVHYRVRKKQAEFWHTQVLIAMLEQRVKKQLFKKPVKITMWWNDRLDIDNHAYMGKMIVDSLKGYIIKDDTRKYFTEVTHKFHSEHYIKVKIEEE